MVSLLASNQTVASCLELAPRNQGQCKAVFARPWREYDLARRFVARKISLQQYSGSVRLPSLPLGEKGSVVEADIQKLSDKMAQNITPLNTSDARGDRRAFRYKSAAVSINRMTLVASGNTPARIDLGASNDLTLMIPFCGNDFAELGPHRVDRGAGDAALMLPRARRSGECSVRSILMVNLDENRLRQVLQSMLGSGNAMPDLRLSETRTLPLKTSALSFRPLLRHLCGLVDALEARPDALALLGIDDMFYRVLSIMLCPGLLHPAEESGSKNETPRREIETVCDYVLANLDKRITLTELEQLSGLSRRSLQYAFFRHFGCSPMEWVRMSRLDAAYRTLRRAHPGTTVTQVALDCGLPRLGTFSSDFRARFGELPSVTLKRALGK